MLEELKQYIVEKNLIKPGDSVVLAISGGIDSMVMAHLFLQLKYRTAIAHCNFNLRGDESDRDEEMVRRFALRNKIPFYSTRFETKTFAKKNKLSIQMAARDLRYKWFEEVRSANGFKSIAVAHNLNDNIETMLINLIRGTGITGLTGMRPSSNRIIRPLLFASRKEIEIYCKKHRIVYREDKSNADTKYTRNKIRHLVVPVLKEINPSVESTLNDTAERLNGINEIVTNFISDLRNRISEQNGEEVSFKISMLKEHMRNRSVLFELFRPYGIINVQLNDLINVITGKTGGQIRTATHRIIKNRLEIIVADKNIINKASFEIDNLRGFTRVPGIKSARSTYITGTFKVNTDPLVACIDAEKVSFPLIIRKWKPGDYFYPFGMKQKKKVSDYFVDKKYSGIDKEKTMILESEGIIVWIIGDRIDNRFRITNTTKKVLIIKAQSFVFREYPGQSE